ncbi:MAG: hypothetical protein PHR16_14400 [Methylovulum sp.]|nr:hypothetical protein [Methylovulum sp.]
MSLLVACADSGATESSYISLGDDNCFQPPSDIRQLYTNRGLGVIECRVKKPVTRLFVVSSQERSWLDIAVGDTLWSTEEQVVYAKENQFGYFPNVGIAPAELLVDQKEAFVGLIFRVTAQDPNRQEQGIANISRLFVLGLRKEGVCFLGLANTNTEARSFLQIDVVCRQILKSSQFMQNGH